MTFLIDADIDGREDMKLIYGIIAVGEKVKPGKDVKVYFSLNLLISSLLQSFLTSRIAIRVVILVLSYNAI